MIGSILVSTYLLTMITASSMGKSNTRNPSSKAPKGCIIENTLASVDILIPATDPLYDTLRLEENLASFRGTLKERDETFQPSVITYPRSEEEIQTIVNFAADCNYKIAVRSGGHQYSGLSSCNRLNGKCIQIDMKHFDHVIYNKDDEEDSDKITTITVAAGVKLGDLSPQNAARGVAIVHGNCGGVAAGGHYQSSSHGGWTRSLGAGMDWIYRIKLVTADGEIRNVYKNEDDLFWAILGGSPGSWGVIIEYEFIPIYDNDYPHSSVYFFLQEYSEDYYKDLFLMGLELLNNEYFKKASDLTWYSVIKPIDALTNKGNYVWTIISWAGNNNGDINNVIPDHPDNKTWYQELVQSFKDLSDKYYETKASVTEYKMTISGFLNSLVVERAAEDQPPYRFYTTHSAYKQDKLDDTIFSNDTLKYEWVDSVTNAITKFTTNSTDNIDIFFQLQYLSPGEDNYAITDDIIINRDPMQNSVSMPTRDIPFQVDAWILFGNNEEGMKKADKAKELAQELKDTLNSNQDEYIINAFGYTDKSYQEYEIDQEFEYFFPERLDVFEKLKEIKTRFDCENVFEGAITIPTNGDCGNERY